MQLHELLRIIQKAEPDELICGGKADPERTQFLHPVPPVGADNGFHVILINGGILITDRPDIFMIFQTETDLVLVRKSDLRIGNDGSQKECMRVAAFRASDPAYPKPYSPGRKLNTPLVVAVNGKTGRMATGTGQLMEL